jgi:hypothetical protein
MSDINVIIGLPSDIDPTTFVGKPVTSEGEVVGKVVNATVNENGRVVATLHLTEQQAMVLGEPLNFDSSISYTSTLNFSTMSWSPCNHFQSIGRLNRKPPPQPKIARVGKYYTLDDIKEQKLPASLKFRTRRLAKRFFKSPMIVTNPQHWEILFGKPHFKRKQNATS